MVHSFVNVIAGLNARVHVKAKMDPCIGVDFELPMDVLPVAQYLVVMFGDGDVEKALAEVNKAINAPELVKCRSDKLGVTCSNCKCKLGGFAWQHPYKKDKFLCPPCGEACQCERLCTWWGPSTMERMRVLLYVVANMPASLPEVTFHKQVVSVSLTYCTLSHGYVR